MSLKYETGASYASRRTCEENGSNGQ